MPTSFLIQCPDWCDQGRTCTGEHTSEGGDYIPATAGMPHSSSHTGGVWFPGVSVSLAWDTIDHLQSAVVIHVSGDGVDTQADLHLHQAERLLEQLAEAVRLLSTTHSGASAAMRPDPDNLRRI